MGMIPEEHYTEERTVRLTGQEIEYIIEELNYTVHNMFEFRNFQKIIDKLKNHSPHISEEKRNPNVETISSGDAKSTSCEHDWEEHGCASPLKEFYICKKCEKEKEVLEDCQDLNQETKDLLIERLQSINLGKVLSSEQLLALIKDETTYEDYQKCQEDSNEEPINERIQFLEMVKESLKSDWAKIRIDNLINYFKSAPTIGCGKDINTEKKGCVYCGDSEGYLCEQCTYIKDALSETGVEE